ncbi:MAG TPA: NADH-ubiquinone oxidoreductase-F iron-sulfur binding region domain-containing protein [Chloroflexota bacterium]|nr:NADH-ubiquinone oxidoreductase-F iron-sulfur binding region domain-containing protein [Chloroflexota bacterium]
MTTQYDALVATANEAVRSQSARGVPRITVGISGCSESVGARGTLRAIRAELERRQIQAIVEETGCRGVCYAEPIVDVELPDGPRIAYGRITADLVPDLIDSVVVKHDARPELALFVVGEQGYAGIPAEPEFDYFKLQQRHVLESCGLIDPLDLNQYVARGGFSALHKVLTTMTREQVIEEVKASGLTGRGGAAFPTGRKWESALASKNRPKYLIDNGEEGEPAIYKDRRIYEGDPFRVIEGVLINAFAIDADEGYIYIGGEHKIAIQRVNRALEIARERGLLGKNVLGTDFSFNIQVRIGGGSYAAGESSAMMSSIEGRRAMPRPKLVRSTERGVWAKPTCMNNVETHANIPLIINRGAAWFNAIGTAKSKGTKVFAVSGQVNRPGMIEVPMGMTLRTMVYDVCGGMIGGRPFKAAQPAGVSSAPVAAANLDVQMAIETLTAIGALLGSGGLVIFDDTVCMVDMNNYLVNFNELESCSRCITCRVGTMRLTDILTRMCTGQGRNGDLEALAWLGPLMEQTTLCGLGQAAPVPAVGAMNIFREEFEAHINDKRCPAGFCEALIEERVPVGVS